MSTGMTTFFFVLLFPASADLILLQLQAEKAGTQSIAASTRFVSPEPVKDIHDAKYIIAPSGKDHHPAVNKTMVLSRHMNDTNATTHPDVPSPSKELVGDMLGHNGYINVVGCSDWYKSNTWWLGWYMQEYVGRDGNTRYIVSNDNEEWWACSAVRQGHYQWIWDSYWNSYQSYTGFNCAFDVQRECDACTWCHGAAKMSTSILAADSYCEGGMYQLVDAYSLEKCKMDVYYQGWCTNVFTWAAGDETCWCWSISHDKPCDTFTHFAGDTTYEISGVNAFAA